VSDTSIQIQVHATMPEHPLVEALSDKAFRLLLELWCWSARHDTAGTVPEASWNRRGSGSLRAELVDAGLAAVDAGSVRLAYLPGIGGAALAQDVPEVSPTPWGSWESTASVPADLPADLPADTDTDAA